MLSLGNSVTIKSYPKLDISLWLQGKSGVIKRIKSTPIGNYYGVKIEQVSKRYLFKESELELIGGDNACKNESLQLSCIQR